MCRESCLAITGRGSELEVVRVGCSVFDKASLGGNAVGT